MNDTPMLVLSIFSAIMVWTTSIIGGVIWLNSKFRSIEKSLYREMDKHRREDDHQFYAHLTRIQRLEIKAFGFTAPNGGAIIPDDGKTFPDR